MKLTEIKHARRFMSKLINDYNAEIISDLKFKSLIWALTQLCQIIKSHEFESRIAIVEQQFLNKLDTKPSANFSNINDLAI